MKRNYLFVVVLGLFMGLVACGPSRAMTEAEATEGAPILPDVVDTAVPEQLEQVAPDQAILEESSVEEVEEYPVAPVLATAVPVAYPIVTVAPAPKEPYPVQEGTLWVMRPVGVQCETAEYADIQAAIADLKAIGVDVLDQGTFEMMVTAVCGSPTSAHFRVLVAVEDVADTAVLGWVPLEN